jgi:hypothetical protein
MTEYEDWKVGRGNGDDVFHVIFRHLNEENEGNYEGYNGSSRFPDRDSNPGTLEYKARVLTTEPRRSSTWSNLMMRKCHILSEISNYDELPVQIYNTSTNNLTSAQ